MPTGYTAAGHQQLGPGLAHDTLTGRSPDEAVNVARLSPNAPFELRAVPSNGAVGRGLERTSSICVRVKCAVAINGDFFGPHNDIPLGGVVSLGRLLRSPSSDHQQLMLSPNGTLSTGELTLTATLITTDLRSLHIDAMNQALGRNGVVLYTPAFGSSTGTPRGTAEVVLRARRPAGPIVLGKTTVVGVARSASHRGNTAIPTDGAVLAANGSATGRLIDVLERIANGAASDDALLRLDASSGAIESIGGGPVLVRHGQVVVPDVHNAFYLGRNPRTIVGWTPAGEILLVTVDGRQPGRSAGMTLLEAAHFMIGLGASEAMNLDGGGSTTFVAQGHVLNVPSDRAVRRGRSTVVVGDVDTKDPILGYVERPVATALVVVPKTGTVDRADDAFSTLPIPLTIQASSVQAAAPASSSDGSEPAIVVPVKSTRSALPIIAFMFVTLAALGAGTQRFLPATLAVRR